MLCSLLRVATLAPECKVTLIVLYLLHSTLRWQVEWCPSVYALLHTVHACAGLSLRLSTPRGASQLTQRLQSC